MDNEVKEEKVECKKKGNGLFTLFACIMTGIIVFLATNLGYKASKVVEPDTNGGNKTTSNVESNSNVTSNVESNVTSNVESNSNVASNVTSNTPVGTKLSAAEALTTGKSLYAKAEASYPSGMNIEESCTHASGSTYDCTVLYNKIKEVYATNNSVSTMLGNEYKNVYSRFTLKNGKYMTEEGGIGYSGSCSTTLTVKAIEENKITYTATTIVSYSNEPSQTKTFDFEITKENGTWKVSKYVYILSNTLK